MSEYQIEWSFLFFDSRDLPGTAFKAVKREKLSFVPHAGLLIYFDHWESFGSEFWLEVSGVDMNMKTGLFVVTLRDHEDALDSQEWRAMQAFFLEQDWEVHFILGRPDDRDEDDPSDIDFKKG